ncbi:hypothetical protein RFI_31474, partial [Reticulomyxa filosa]
FSRAYSSSSLPPIPNNGQQLHSKMASVQELFTDTDKFTYDTDVNSLTANIDIEKLTSGSNTEPLAGGSAQIIDYDHMDDISLSSLSVQNDPFLQSFVSIHSVSANHNHSNNATISTFGGSHSTNDNNTAAATTASTSAITNSNNNNNNNNNNNDNNNNNNNSNNNNKNNNDHIDSKSEDDDDDGGIGSLFDDPDLLKELPPINTSLLNQFHHSSSHASPSPANQGVFICLFVYLFVCVCCCLHFILQLTWNQNTGSVSTPASSVVNADTTKKPSTEMAHIVVSPQHETVSPRIVVTTVDNERKEINTIILPSTASSSASDGGLIRDNIQPQLQKQSEPQSQLQSQSQPQSMLEEEKTYEDEKKIKATEETGRLVSTFEGLKSIDTTRLTQEDIEQYKEELQQKKLVSTFAGLKSIDALSTSELEAHKAEILHNTKESHTPVHLNEEEKARINSAKEKFNHQSGTAFLFMQDAELLKRQENQHQLEEAAKVSNFHGLESTAVLRTTVDSKEQQQVAD